jgi:hypothetical protein
MENNMATTRKEDPMISTNQQQATARKRKCGFWCKAGIVIAVVVITLIIVVLL